MHRLILLLLPIACLHAAEDLFDAVTQGALRVRRADGQNAQSRDLLATQQHNAADCFNGSWDPQNQTYPGHQRGRLQSTIYAVLRLEVYYAYTPVRRPMKPPQH